MKNDNVFMIKIMQQVNNRCSFRDICRIADEMIMENIEYYNFRYKYVFVNFKVGDVFISKHFKSEYKRDGAMVYNMPETISEFDIFYKRFVSNNNNMFNIDLIEVTLTEEKLNKQL